MPLIRTVKGLIPSEAMERRDPVFEDENEVSRAVEYYLDGELVHRSAHVHLKQGVSLTSAIEDI